MHQRRLPGVWRPFGLALVLVVTACMSSTPAGRPPEPPAAYGGSLQDGAAWRGRVPAAWNRTLVVYSHGYVLPGAANPALDAPDEATAGWLLGHGYAVAGSSYASTGWAVADAVADQRELIQRFGQRVGSPSRVLAWGDSLGGLVTAALAARPGTVNGALAMCGPLAGSVAAWNLLLDASYAFRTLVAPDARLLLTGIPSRDAGANEERADRALVSAESTPAGLARLALVAALLGEPPVFEPGDLRIGNDLVTEARREVLWVQAYALPFSLDYRAELEARLGGNPSGNAGTDYGARLRAAPGAAMVAALYQRASLDLQADLDRLARAPRVTADAAAAAALAKGDAAGPPAVSILTLHTTGDGLAIAAHETTYAEAVAAAGASARLRQLWVDRAGHCSFTPGERLAALLALQAAVVLRRWNDATLTPARMNAEATGFGAKLSSVGPLPAQPAFTSFLPPAFPPR